MSRNNRPASDLTKLAEHLANNADLAEQVTHVSPSLYTEARLEQLWQACKWSSSLVSRWVSSA